LKDAHIVCTVCAGDQIAANWPSVYANGPLGQKLAKGIAGGSAAIAQVAEGQ